MNLKPKCNTTLNFKISWKEVDINGVLVSNDNKILFMTTDNSLLSVPNQGEKS